MNIIPEFKYIFLRISEKRCWGLYLKLPFESFRQTGWWGRPETLLAVMKFLFACRILFSEAIYPTALFNSFVWWSYILHTLLLSVLLITGLGQCLSRLIKYFYHQPPNRTGGNNHFVQKNNLETLGFLLFLRWPDLINSLVGILLPEIPVRIIS